MDSQPSQATNSDRSQEDNEAELYAASAAENALPDGKAPGIESTDLSALSAALKDPNSVDTAESNGDESRNTPAEELDRVLTKEEMVEEALNCPCIAAMRDGPCGDSFIAAYRCFLESETEPKGMDCMEQFTGMQSCMADHPEEYNMDDDDEDPFSVGEEKQENQKTREEAREDPPERVDSSVTAASS